MPKLTESVPFSVFFVSWAKRESPKEPYAFFSEILVGQDPLTEYGALIGGAAEGVRLGEEPVEWVLLGWRELDVTEADLRNWSAAGIVVTRYDEDQNSSSGDDDDESDQGRCGA